MLAAVDQHRAEVDREAARRRRPSSRRAVAPAAERPAQVAAEQAERRDRVPGPPGGLDDGPGLGVGSHDHAVGGQQARASPQASPLRTVTATVAGGTGAGLAATTSSSVDDDRHDAAEQRLGRLAGGPGRAGVRGDVADLAQQVDELS